MSKLKSVWVYAEKPETVSSFCAGAKELGETITLLFFGERLDAERFAALGADRVLVFGDEQSHRIEDCIETIDSMILKETPDLLIFDKNSRCKMLAATLAAKRGSSVLHNVMEFVLGDELVVRQMVYGGSAIRTLQSSSSTVFTTASTATFDLPLVSSKADLVSVDYVPTKSQVKRLDWKNKESATVDLSDAKRVVTVGRGIATKENVRMVEEFASLIGAEMGCTRPVSEALGLMESERYIGVSGVIFKPELYITVGVSGQVQHMVGCNQSGYILSINKDKSASIFKQSDYGIVGDLRTIIPKLIDKLKSSS
jgi:electron transfer flavoprotein alpha subunit